ncbi:dihydropteroate synthase [Furfurilactobacillus entadae]|uniref:dihydropteroate synthase n=1 Tax=Furfurilactobacillus entadae TaxID=2922307 RepID=UPI0035EC6B53
MKLSELTTKPATTFAEAALADAMAHHQQIGLQFSEFSGEEQNRLVALLGNLDAVTFSSSADQASIQTLVSSDALPVLANQLERQFADSALVETLQTIQRAHEVHWLAGRFDFNVSTTPLIYGIVNVSPESFYDGGRYVEMTSILNRVQELVDAGVPVIELGGQTTRPGFKELPVDVEIDRVVPAIRAVKTRFPEVAIAVDTYKLPVTKAVLAEGVDIINDVNAFTDDLRKLTLLAPSSVGVLTMHASRGHEYENLTTSMRDFFTDNLAALEAAGIDRERIALDEGIGYAKVADGYQDFTMMRNIDQFLPLQRPLMIAISRKGFGHKLFGLAKDDRLPVTLIAEAYMYLHGGRILRVHDATETVQLVKLLQTIESSYWFPDRDEPTRH